MRDGVAIQLAARAQLMNLLNITLLPGVAFVVLLLIARRHWHHSAALVRCHVRGAVWASIWAGVLLGMVSISIVGMGGLTVPGTWVVLLLYFICCHSALILMALYAWSRAAAGQEFRYPLIGIRRW
ncbi:hypothetical protein [Chitinivorax sp. B]|uniref:hypothetical protein n=1 Tax=Chitinivorax sp. B TaxID=2502235 RepID=UPI0010F7260B|nr:hypothetical protein [Chitinivorax sp. B]